MNSKQFRKPICVFPAGMANFIEEIEIFLKKQNISFFRIYTRKSAWSLFVLPQVKDLSILKLGFPGMHYVKIQIIDPRVKSDSQLYDLITYGIIPNIKQNKKNDPCLINEIFRLFIERASNYN